MIKEQISQQLKEQAIRSFFSGDSRVAELSRSLGVERSTIYRWVAKFKRSKSLKRMQNPLSGRQAKISGSNIKKVLRILKQPASKYGYETDFWTTHRLRRILKSELGLDLSRMSIHRSLRKIKFSYRKPEIRYVHKNKKENLKKWDRQTVPAIKRVIKKYRAILYFEDESSISLSPTVAKTWAPIGEKLTRPVSANRGSVSAISAISSSGRLIFNVHDGAKRFNSDDIIEFLTQMLKHHPRRHLAVVMDQAPCHKSKKVKFFISSQKNLHVFYLPPRTPEFNPDEKVWEHLKNQELKDHTAVTTNELKKLTKRKLKKNVSE